MSSSLNANIVSSDFTEMKKLKDEKLKLLMVFQYKYLFNNIKEITLRSSI